jgi:hypothetical protein
LGELRVDLSEAPDPMRGASPVLVRGRLDPETQTLRATRVEPSARFGPDIEQLSVEGFVHGRSGDRFGLGAIEVDARGVSDRIRELRTDDRVRVSGRLDPEGRLRAERIELRRSWTEGPEDQGQRGGDARTAEESAERSERSDRTDRADRSEREDRVERAERPERVDRPERVERPERPERVERPERIERPERPERPDRSGRR